MVDRDKPEKYLNPPSEVARIGVPYGKILSDNDIRGIPAGQILVGLFRSATRDYDIAAIIEQEERLSEMIDAGHELTGLFVVPRNNVQRLQTIERMRGAVELSSGEASTAYQRKKNNHLLFHTRVAQTNAELFQFDFISVFDNYQAGEFSHIENINLFWRAPDWFEYTPSALQEFRFRSHAGDIVTPGSMFTDGGSIPRVFWITKNLSPWGYLPAFLLHDWQFDQHHSGTSAATFESVRDLMMEAVKTLMVSGVCPLSELDFNLIYHGINSAFARDIWNSTPGVTLPNGEDQ